ncbi:MAG: D-aminoacyl-tRNA deacylase [Methanobacteriota archaeon]|nr:MAG: D-aminoacyl-tRNA deacylase [Euryarchaeota archaeon]
MRLIVTSAEDIASMNIRTQLLENGRWHEKGEFSGHPVLEKDEYTMVLIDGLHLGEDGIDGRAQSQLKRSFEVTIFASRHKAASKIPTLTVHPTGNYSDADFGGLPGRLSPSSPQLMTQALRSLKTNAAGQKYDVSFETTHHGPLTDGPAFYIEIGSYEELWHDEKAAAAIAQTILSLEETRYPEMVCVGGGHYAPRFTDVALTRKVAVGHMAANYALEALDDDMIAQMMDKSGGAERVYFHRKSMPKAKYRQLSERFASLGIGEVRSADFEPLLP